MTNTPGPSAGEVGPEAARQRRRRSPEEAEREILDAAEAFLREQPFREMTVGELMARTGLSRSAFYFYFRDRYGVVERLLEGIGAALFEADRPWLEGGPRGGVREAREQMRTSVRAGIGVFARHGPVLRAVSDAAANDPEVERAYRHGFVEGFVGPITARIRGDAAEGLVPAELDPEQTARALVWMVERYGLDTLGCTPPAADADLVASIVESIWLRTLYGPEGG